MIMAGDEERIKRKITSVLRSHREGLTIKDLSTLVSAHRQTIAKYVLVLEAEGVVYRREVGSATLHYLKKFFGGKING